MRHQKKSTSLGRKKAPREALIKNLAQSLILHEKIKTTKVKAKTVRSYVEKLVTKAKDNNLASRRFIASKLFTNNAVKKLMDELAPRYNERKGGYTRIINMSPRKGDGAEQAIIEFV